MTVYGTTSTNQQTFTYTANGERLTKVQGGVTTTYAYDAFGNLLSVVPSSGTRVDYVVDGLGHRVGRKVGGESTASTQYLWDGVLRVVASANSSGTIQQRYIYATHANVPDLVIDATNGNKVYRVVTDHLGSVRMVVGLDDGVVKERHSYDAWGNELSGSYGPAYVASGWTRIPFGFAGGLYDVTTGLYRFGARDYDPVVGRWMAKDPIKFDGGSTGLYAYVNNDPANRNDKNGLMDPLGFNSALDPGSALLRLLSSFLTTPGEIASNRFPDISDPHNNAADAFRHCVASCMVTTKSSALIANILGTGYELAEIFQPSNERTMDLHNNRCGRNAAGNSSDPNVCANACNEQLNSGALMTSPPSQ